MLRGLSVLRWSVFTHVRAGRKFFPNMWHMYSTMKLSASTFKASKDWWQNASIFSLPIRLDVWNMEQLSSSFKQNWHWGSGLLQYLQDFPYHLNFFLIHVNIETMFWFMMFYHLRFQGKDTLVSSFFRVWLSLAKRKKLPTRHALHFHIIGLKLEKSNQRRPRIGQQWPNHFPYAMAKDSILRIVTQLSRKNIHDPFNLLLYVEES